MPLRKELDMKRLLLVLAVAAFALPATALAKGPSEARITGPGLSKAIVITGEESEGSPIMDLADAAGFFPAAFGQSPNPMTSRPTGALGPKYSIDYTVPGGNMTTFKIHQDAYPYAKPYSVTYMKAGQPIFDMETKGGWFTDTRLKEVLVLHGLAKSAPTATSSSSTAGFFSTGKLGALVLVLLVLGGVFVLMRRRTDGKAA
jgi:hypothetical protein